MAWPLKAARYDRAHLLDAAQLARVRKRRTRAIALYRWVLALEPENLEIHAKLAPLLAETGQVFDAWCSFKTLARAHLREGHEERALAVYREAVLYLPREVQAWQAVAQLQYKRGQGREALETLLDGSRQFRTRWLRPQAIHLLRRARRIEFWNFEVVLDLAGLLAASQQRHEARMLLNGLVEREGGERLQRVRAAQLRLSPGPQATWRWLRSVLAPDPDLPPNPAPIPSQTPRAGVVALPTRRAS